jgi:hypothetical protein
MNGARLLKAYRALYALLIILASVQTALAAYALPHLLTLALVEIAGAALLCVRRTQRAGLVLLLLVFAGAQLLEALAGEWPTRYLQYALSALFIVLLDGALSVPRAAALPR